MRGSRLVMPAAVRITMNVYCIRKDGMAKQVLDVDGGNEVPGVTDLQESRLLACLPDRKDWRLMTTDEVATFRADLAREDKERAEFMAALEEMGKLHADEIDHIMKTKFGWLGSGA